MQSQSLQHSSSRLGQLWSGLSLLRSDRGYRFEPATAFCVDVDGITKI